MGASLCFVPGRRSRSKAKAAVRSARSRDCVFVQCTKYTVYLEPLPNPSLTVFLPGIFFRSPYPVSKSQFHLKASQTDFIRDKGKFSTGIQKCNCISKVQRRLGSLAAAPGMLYGRGDLDEAHPRRGFRGCSCPLRAALTEFR